MWLIVSATSSTGISSAISMSALRVLDQRDALAEHAVAGPHLVAVGLDDAQHLLIVGEDLFVPLDLRHDLGVLVDQPLDLQPDQLDQPHAADGLGLHARERGS